MKGVSAASRTMRYEWVKKYLSQAAPGSAVDAYELHQKMLKLGMYSSKTAKFDAARSILRMVERAQKELNAAL